MAIQKYSVRESVNRILRLFGDGIQPSSDAPDTVPGEVYSTDEAISRLAELLGNSLDGVTATMPQALQSALSNVGSIQFDTSFTPNGYPEGHLSWNHDEGTLDLVQEGANVIQQIGQEVFFYVKNQTGNQIDDGTVVMFDGSVGASGRLLITPAIADGTYPSVYIMGITTENIPNGEDGYVTAHGKVRGLVTNGSLYGESWADGDILYANPDIAGGLTKNLPHAPHLKVPIAAVVDAKANNGTLFVRPSYTPDIHELNDVQVSTGTYDKSILAYSVTGSLWENKTLDQISNPVTILVANTSLNVSHAVVKATQPITITLPSAVGLVKSYSITNDSSGRVIVQCSGSEKLGKSNRWTIAKRYSTMTIYSDGTGWQFK